jgi:hypothetical protein
MPPSIQSPGLDFDLKYDGFRALAYIEAVACRLCVPEANPI